MIQLIMIIFCITGWYNINSYAPFYKKFYLKFNTNFISINISFLYYLAINREKKMELQQLFGNCATFYYYDTKDQIKNFNDQDKVKKSFIVLSIGLKAVSLYFAGSLIYTVYKIKNHLFRIILTFPVMYDVCKIASNAQKSDYRRDNVLEGTIIKDKISYIGNKLKELYASKYAT